MSIHYPVGAMRRIVRLGSSGQATSSKMRNKPTVVDGERFDSKKEAERWRQLHLLQRNGELRNITRQVTYELRVNGKLICKYRADFEYEERRGDIWSKITEDVKGQKSGTPYQLFKLKAKLMMALNGIEIRET